MSGERAGPVHVHAGGGQVHDGETRGWRSRDTDQQVGPPLMATQITENALKRSAHTTCNLFVLNNTHVNS